MVQPARKEPSAPECRRVCVVGPGTRFLSGITYYTYSLIRALQEDGHRCSAVLVRRLLPVWLYPEAPGLELHSQIFVCPKRSKEWMASIGTGDSRSSELSN